MCLTTGSTTAILVRSSDIFGTCNLNVACGEALNVSMHCGVHVGLADSHGSLTRLLPMNDLKNDPDDHEVLHLDVLVGDEASPFSFSPSDLASSVLLDVLPPAKKAEASKFEIRDANQGNKGLEPGKSLCENGVGNDHVLSVVKKHGGGG